MPPSGGTSSTVTTQELSPEQRKLIDIAMPRIESYAEQDLELFPGSTIVGPTQTQQDARQEVLNTSQTDVKDLSTQSLDVAKQFTTQGTQGGLDAAQGLTRAGQLGNLGVGGLLADYSAGTPGRRFIESGALLDPATNPVLGKQTEAAIRPLTKSLTEEVMPGIRSQFVGDNMFGSSRQGIAEGRAIDSFTQEAGDIATELQMNNFNQGLGAMLSSLNSGRSAGQAATSAGLGAGEAGAGQLLGAATQGLTLSPSLAQLAYLPGMTKEAIGGLEQREQQALLSEEADRFTTEQMLPFMQGQDIAQLAFGMPGGTASSMSQQNPAFSPLQTGLGLMMSLPMLFGGGGGAGIGAGAGLLGLLGSDRRLKKNIRKIGETNGLNIYSFDYVTNKDGTDFIGVMADEVPWAIAGQVNGYDFVDYGRIAA
jgi:hypothetical protein